MDFYFIFCGALTILCAFNVFENALKKNNIKRWVATIFLAISCVLSVLGYFKVFDVYISYNIMLFLLLFAYYFLTLKSLKNYLFASLTALIFIAILMCYYAFDFDFEYLFFDPIIYISIPLGIVCNYICKNFKTFFVGSVLGVICFELIYFEVSYGVALEIGVESLMSFLIVGLTSFSLWFCVKEFAKKSKQNKKQQYNS